MRAHAVRVPQRFNTLLSVIIINGFPNKDTILLCLIPDMHSRPPTVTMRNDKQIKHTWNQELKDLNFILDLWYWYKTLVPAKLQSSRSKGSTLQVLINESVLTKIHHFQSMIIQSMIDGREVSTPNYNTHSKLTPIFCNLFATICNAIFRICNSTITPSGNSLWWVS